MLNKHLPIFFKYLLWFSNFKSIDPAKHQRLILVNSINYGELRYWRWLLKYYGKDQIAQFIRTIPASEFRGPSLKLFRLLLKINQEPIYASRSDYIASKKSSA